MTNEQDLRVIATRLLEDAGLTQDKIIHEAVRPDHFGDGEVIFEVGPMHLRFVRERGQDFIDVSPASTPGRYYPFGDVELAMGWKTVDEVWSRAEPEPLSAILERVRKHYPQFEEAFSSTTAPETLAKLDFASRRRGTAFVNHLRQVAEDARKK